MEISKVENRSKIPKILHQIWIDRDNPNSPIPSKYRDFRKTLERHNPDWQFKTWNDVQIQQVIESTPELKPYLALYRRMRYPVTKADIARLVVLYLQGGLYLDLDFICYRSLTLLLEKYPRDVLLVAEPPESSFTWRLANGFLASVALNPLWLELLDEISRRMKNVRCQRGLDVCAKTGPVVLTEYLQDSDLQWREWVVPTRLILPYLPNKRLSQQVRASPGLATSEGPNLQLQSVEFSEAEGPFLASLWWEGSGWGDERTRDLILEFLTPYLVVVPILTFLVVLIFRYGKGLEL